MITSTTPHHRFTSTTQWIAMLQQISINTMNKAKYKFLRLPQVKITTGLSKSTIYARIAEGTFPKQISLGPRLVVWIESDIQNWISQQVAAARG